MQVPVLVPDYFHTHTEHVRTPAANCTLGLQQQGRTCNGGR